VIVNTDGSVLQPLGRATGRGIIRNTSGICQAAFAANFGACSITRAELRAALHGHQIAWNLGYRQVSFQVDSAVVVAFLCNNAVDDLRHQACIDELKQLLGLN
ncbi:Putative ribonuclease H protein At1g65750, partial [Linum grandiflorum]